MMKINVSQACIHQWDNLKMKKTSRYIIFDVNEKEEIVVERVGEREASWDEFLGHLPKDDMRFCVYDFEFTNRDSMCINKLIFVSWAPETAKGKRKLIFASSKELFKKNLPGVMKDYQASNLQDIDHKDIQSYFDR